MFQQLLIVDVTILSIFHFSVNQFTVSSRFPLVHYTEAPAFVVFLHLFIQVFSFSLSPVCRFFRDKHFQPHF